MCENFVYLQYYFLKVSFPEVFALYIDADLIKDEGNIMSWNFPQFIVPSSIFFFHSRWLLGHKSLIIMIARTSD